MRVFAGIALPESVTDHLSHALEMISPTNQKRALWIPSTNWHVTLGFYGEQPEGMEEELTENLRRAARTVAPFEIGLAGAGVFHKDVCWIGIRDPREVLGPLADEVRGDHAARDQHAKNRFHVTVSRSGRHGDLANAMAALSVYQGPTWMVDRLTLFESRLGEGMGGHPLYTVLAEVPLGRLSPANPRT